MVLFTNFLDFKNKRETDFRYNNFLIMIKLRIILTFLLYLVLGSTSTYDFTESSEIKEFPKTIYGFELKSSYLFTSADKYGYLDKYDDDTLEDIWTTPSYTYISWCMEMDLMRNWFFTAPHNSTVHPLYFYQYQQSGSFMRKNITFSSSYARYAWNLDLSGDYLLANSQYRNTLFQYIDGQFEETFSWYSMSRTYGAEICEDKMVLAHEYNGSYSLFKVYAPASSSEEYTETQSFELTNDNRYILTTTDDCGTAILTPYYQSNITIFIFTRSKYDKFTLQSKTIYESSNISNSYAYDACISPGGNLFAIAASSGVSVWTYDPSENQFVHIKRIASGRKIQCAINQNTIMFSENGNGMHRVEYSPEDPYPNHYTQNLNYYKSNLQFTLKNTLTDASSEIVDIHAEGDHLFYFEKYGKSYVNDKQDDGTYDLNKTVDENHFFQKTVSNNKYKLLVQSSLDNNIYVYQDAGTDKSYESVFNLTTASRVLDIDINAEGVLLVGLESGDMIEYLWDDDEGQFTENQKNTDEFGRVQEVKMCSDGTKLGIVRKFEKFYFQFFTSHGMQLRNQTLEELVDVHMTATSDCQKVFIASQMQQKVEILARVYDHYDLVKTMSEDLPISDLALNPDGDVLAVSKLFGKKITVYSMNCNGDYAKEKDFSGVSAVQITNYELILADCSGNVKIYSYSFGIASCGSSGYKKFQAINVLNTVDNAKREITSVKVSGNEMVASSKHSGLYLFEKGTEGFVFQKHLGGNIFITDVDILSSLNTFVAASNNRSVLVYKDKGEGYDLSETIQTESQALHVDMSENKKVLVGMMNGDLALFFPGVQSYAILGSKITNEGQSIFGAALCSDDSKIALIEKEGVFRMVIYSPDNIELASFTEELEEEYIEPYLSASSDCKTVAISGISMGKVKVFREDVTQLKLFRTIDVGEPLGEVSLEQDGDILVVPSLTNKKSFVYHFTWCQEEYDKMKELTSASYDGVTAMSDKYIAQGGENGNIKIHEYSWVENTECLNLASETNLNGIRRKQGDRNSVENNQETQPQVVSSRPDEGLRSESPETLGEEEKAESLSAGAIVAIVLGSLAISSTVIILVIWKLKKKKHEHQVESDGSQSAQTIQ